MSKKNLYLAVSDMSSKDKGIGRLDESLSASAYKIFEDYNPLWEDETLFNLEMEDLVECDMIFGLDADEEVSIVVYELTPIYDVKVRLRDPEPAKYVVETTEVE